MKNMQSFSHRDSQYERPNQDFTCGRAKDGSPCMLGPNRNGSCRGGYECRPLRKNDRFLCTRSPAAGGVCESGPLPNGACCRPILKCRPKMTHRKMRGTLVRWTATFTIAALALIMAGSSYLDFISPGPLSSHHGGTDMSCGDCHSAASGSAVSLLSLALSPESGDDQIAMCTECHAMGPNPLASHGLPVEEMTVSHDRIIAAGHTGGVGGIMKMRDRDFRDDTACKRCHSEHKGKMHRPAVLDNQCCQSCHERVFDGLSYGHPDFNQYPHKRRTRLNFDHVSHISNHFEEETDLAPDSCSDCHTLDKTGSHMLVRGFDQTCASCHLGEIKGEAAAGIKGFQVLAVPGLDAETLTEAGIHIGEWPFFAENSVTPYMKLLLSSQPGMADDLMTLKGVDTLDLSGATDAQKQAAGRLAWQVKVLLDELNTGGQTGLAKRFGNHVDPGELSQLTALLSPADVKNAAQLWFPNLKAELADYRSGKTVKAAATTTTPSVTITAEKPPVTDDILAGDDDILAGDDDDILAGDDDDILAGDDDDILAGDDDILAGDDDDILAGDDDILAGDDDDILAGDDDILAGDEGDILAGDDDDILSDDADLSMGSDKSKTAPVKTVTEEEWVALGGWFQAGYSLYYRPSGHEDGFLRAWLDLTADYNQFEHGDCAQEVFEKLADPKSPGGCTKCHSIDQEGEGLKINWLSKQHNPYRKDFTRFTHQPHQSLIGQKGCAECHVLDVETPYADGFEDRDPNTFSSNFQSIKLDTCAACHTPQGSGDECLDCHNYHIGTFIDDHLSKAKLKYMGKTQE